MTILYKLEPRGVSTRILDHFRFLRALQDKYGRRGLDIVALDQTEGWFRDSVYDDAAMEMKARRRYWLDEYRFPGVLGIFRIMEWRQLQSGIWQHRPTPRDIAYPLRITIIDAQGRVVYACSGGDGEFPREYIDMLVDRLSPR